MSYIKDKKGKKPIISRIIEKEPLTYENVEGKQQPTAIFHRDQHKLSEEMAQKHDHR